MPLNKETKPNQTKPNHSVSRSAYIYGKVLDQCFIFEYYRVVFGFFVLWHINLHGLFNAKAILVEPHVGEKEVHNFSTVISPKVNVIRRCRSPAR